VRIAGDATEDRRADRHQHQPAVQHADRKSVMRKKKRKGRKPREAKTPGAASVVDAIFKLPGFEGTRSQGRDGQLWAVAIPATVVPD
jgi:hypothetical protein